MSNDGNNAKAALVSELNGLLADHMALFFKTKNFHWHVAGPRFRDLHLLFDEQAIEIRDQIDAIGERVRKNDEYTLTSIGSVAKHTQVKDQDDVTLTADAMVKRLKAMKELAEQAGDNATDGLIDDWTDMAEERVWFLNQTLK